jgi:hypothetical protein
MKYILPGILLLSMIVPAFAQHATKSQRAAVEQLKRHSAVILTPFIVSPGNENWDFTFDKPKDQNSGG